MPGTATLCSLSEVIKAVPTAVNYKHTNTELVVSNELLSSSSDGRSNINPELGTYGSRIVKLRS